MSDSSMPWVKMYTEMLDDTKLGRVSERARWRFVQLILMAGECDAEGYLADTRGPMSTEDIAWRIRKPAAIVAADMDTLSNLGLIVNTDRGWYIPKFSERQGRSQSEKRAKWRESQSKRREKNLGPEWELAEMPENLPPVIDDTAMTPAPRVEKSREDIPAAQPAAEESPTPDLPPVEVKRPPTARQIAIGVLETHFADMTHLAPPARRTLNDRKKAATRWWNPLGTVYDAADRDVDRARAALTDAYQRMRSGDRPLTVAAPQSVEKTALAVLAEQAGPSPRANGAYPLPEGA